MMQIVESVAENDFEVKKILINIANMNQTNNLEEILQLNKGMKKCYMVENSKVVTQVY
jgi:hypothetical protein